MIISRSIQVAANGIISFFFMAYVMANDWQILRRGTPAYTKMICITAKVKREAPRSTEKEVWAFEDLWRFVLVEGEEEKFGRGLIFLKAKMGRVFARNI